MWNIQKYQPSKTVPDNLYGERVAVNDNDTTNLGYLDWKDLFTDSALQRLIEKGLLNNTDYQSAQLRVEEAEATLLSAKLAFYHPLPLHRKVQSAVLIRPKRLRHIVCLLLPVGK